MSMATKEWLSVEEAAQVLGVKADTVRLWLRKGILTGRKLGKLWLIHVSEVKKRPE